MAMQAMKNMMNMRHTKKTMTNRTRRTKRKTGKLKLLLLTSSFVATLAGTQLLNIKDALQVAAAADNNAITMVEPAVNDTVILLPPNGRGEQIVLKQIPQAVQPQFRPVARSRSSN